MSSVLAGHADIAYPKFSPVARYADQSLSDPTALSVAFGLPMTVLETTTTAIRVRLDDGRDAWLRRRDVYVSESGQVLTDGTGFRVLNRPVLRFWGNHSDLVEFLSRGAATTRNADFEEVLARSPSFGLRLPVLAVDEIAVLGDTSARVAAVMMPIHSKTLEMLQEVGGDRQGTYDIQVLVDASGDAEMFSQKVLTALSLDLSRRLSRDGNLYRVNLSRFGNAYRSGYSLPEKTDLAGLGKPLEGLTEVSKVSQEPILPALAGVMPSPREGRSAGVLLILSGADLQPTASVAALGGAVSLDTFSVPVPEDVTVILAQVTPEPAPGLARLAKRFASLGKSELIGFSPTLARSVSDRVVVALAPAIERSLEAAELEQVCQIANAERLFCALPFQATTAAALPAPPVSDTPLDWYSAVVWVVVENLIVKLGKDASHIP